MFSLYRLEICLSSSNRFFDHGAGEIYFLNNLLGSFFFFFWRLPPTNLLSFFLMVTSLN